MNLYVTYEGKDVPLDYKAATRCELACKTGHAFRIADHHYTVNDVYAKPNSGHVTVAIIVFGILGLLGGPFGVLIGCTIGFAIGEFHANEERAKARIFNESTVEGGNSPCDKAQKQPIT